MRWIQVLPTLWESDRRKMHRMPKVRKTGRRITRSTAAGRGQQRQQQHELQL